jgi:hypothetical protein
VTVQSECPTGTPSALRLPETGWAQAHRLRGKGVRTCLPAVADGDPAGQERPGAEEHIVRGED